MVLAQKPPDYNFEVALNRGGDVSCVSLGSYCAVAACLNILNLRQAAYPFDWNRTTIEGVIHFLQTGFKDFLTFLSVKDFPAGADTGGKTYCGEHHSVWHEDLATMDGHEKYKRRIERFYSNGSPRILFIRAINSSVEAIHARALLQVLQGLFADSQVFLLLIIPCQPVAQTFVVDGTHDKLLIHCISGWSTTGEEYAEAVRAIYSHARCSERNLHEERPPLAKAPLEDVLQVIAPFFGGYPQQVPFTPQPLPVHMCQIVVHGYAPHLPNAVPGRAVHPLVNNGSGAQLDSAGVGMLARSAQQPSLPPYQHHPQQAPQALRRQPLQHQQQQMQYQHQIHSDSQPYKSIESISLQWFTEPPPSAEPMFGKLICPVQQTTDAGRLGRLVFSPS